MKRTRNLAIAIGAVIVAATSAWLLWTGTGTDARPQENPAPEQKRAARSDLAYPPAFGNPTPPISASGPPGKDEVDLCGYGRVNEDRLPTALVAEADAAILRVVDGLEHSKDDREQARGLLMHALLDAQIAFAKVMDADGGRCHETSECEAQAAEAYAQAAVPAIEALVRLATTTRDAQTYATAMRACRSIVPDSPPTSCSVLNTEQWAQLDPDNALAWLLAARAARHRKDEAAFQDALLRASRAKTFDRRTTRFGDILASSDVRYEPVRTLIIRRLEAAEDRPDPGDFFSNFTLAGQHCQKANEARMHQVCNDLAQVLTEGSADQLGLQVGTLFVGRKGWSQTDYMALERELQAARPRPGNLSCKWSAQAEEWLQGVMKYGELGYMRQLIARQKPR